MYMKKTIILASVMLFAVGAQAQFLGKLLDKAADKVVNRVTGKSSEKVDDIFLDPHYGIEVESRETFYYEGNVTPVAASDIVSLLGKLPSIPTGSELLHPTRNIATSFDRDLRAVSERASLLEESTEEAATAQSMAQHQEASRDAQRAQEQAMARAQQAQAQGAKAAEILNSMPEADRIRLMQLGQKLENMSDQQAEAYLKAHPDDMAFVQKYAALFAQIGSMQPAHPQPAMPVMSPTKLAEDKARSIIYSALDFEDFVKKESAKISANSHEELQLKMANAWNKYLNGVVADVKRELLAVWNDSEIPSYLKQFVYEDVSILCDYLGKAYDCNFADLYPINFRQDVVRQIMLEPEEILLRPENMLANYDASKIYKRNTETNYIFRFNNGKWSRMPDDFEVDILNDVEPLENQILTGTGGKQAVISGTAGFVRLPEGNILYPIAVSVTGNTIRWTDLVEIEGQTPDAQHTWQIVEYTYTL